MVFVASVVIANLAVVTTGLCFGWTSPSIEKLKAPESELRVSDDEASWIASLMTVGSAAGSIIASLVLNLIGRKRTLLFAALPYVTGWLIIVFAETAKDIYIGRVILGIGVGFTLTALPLYFSEIAPSKRRGAAGLSVFFALKLGILMAYVIGMFVSAKLLALISTAVPLVFGILFTWCPETPYYVMLKGDYEKAKISLMQLRDSEEVDEEMEMITGMIRTDLATNTSFFDLFTNPTNRKAFIIMFFLVIAQYTTGSQAITAYAETIFEAAQNRINGGYMSIILGVVQLVSVFATILLVDHGGRRPLLLLSTFGVAICTFTIAVYFYLRDSGQNLDSLHWVASTSVIAFTIMYALGLSSIPNMMIAEVFPASVKPKAAGIFGILADVCSFLVIKFFYLLMTHAGMHVPFFIYSLCSILGICHIAFFVPETKRKTLQEVQDILKKPKEKTNDFLTIEISHKKKSNLNQLAFFE